MRHVKQQTVIIWGEHTLIAALSTPEQGICAAPPKSPKVLLICLIISMLKMCCVIGLTFPDYKVKSTKHVSPILCCDASIYFFLAHFALF